MKSTVNPEQFNRLTGLDVLRGMAILLVVAGHYLPRLVGGVAAQFVYTLGGAGVILFFYLSGFLIFRNVQKQSVRVFLTRRFFKLFPAYWANIVAILIVAALGGDVRPDDTKTVLSNILMIQEFTHVDLLNGVFWTLQVEVKFYLIIALFHAMFGVKRIYFLLAALFLGNALTFAMTHHGSVLLTYLITFFPGIAAARIALGGKARRGLMELAGVTVVTALNLLFFMNSNNSFHAIHALIFGPLLVLALRGGWNWAVPRFFGRISYSLYMYHSSVGYLLLALVAPLGGWAGWGWVAAVFAATVAIATASFLLIEQPAVAFGRGFEELPPFKKRVAIRS